MTETACSLAKNLWMITIRCTIDNPFEAYYDQDLQNRLKKNIKNWMSDWAHNSAGKRSFSKHSYRHLVVFR